MWRTHGGAVMPTTGLGRWAGWLLVASIVLFALMIVAYNTGFLGVGTRTAGELSVGVAATIAVVGTVVTGAISWLRSKDHSLVVLAATSVGLLLTVILAFGQLAD